MAHHCETVPLTLSISLAAAIAGVSRVTFRKRFMHTGLCHTTTELDDLFHNAGVGRVWTWELSQALSRKLALGEVQAAESALDQKERRCQRNYRTRQRAKRKC
jgi:hypothetical protein